MTITHSLVVNRKKQNKKSETKVIFLNQTFLLTDGSNKTSKSTEKQKFKGV